jgi:hypothetical protein
LSAANVARVERFVGDLAEAAGAEAVREAFSKGRASSWHAMLERAATTD